MKRRKELFEFIDLNIRPAALRDGMTNIMQLLHRLLRTDKILASKITHVVKITGMTEILDLCSGAGGPFPELLFEMKNTHGISLQVTLSDFIPHKTAKYTLHRKCRGIHYMEKSVDASHIPAHTGAIRTLFLGFHHMPPGTAKSILHDAYKKNQPLCIFEISEHSWRGILAALFVPFIIFIFTPFIKPSFSQIFFTYIIPLIPFMMTWDGIVSQLRTYSVDELRELTADLRKPDYHWDIGVIKVRYLSHESPYLMGIPVKESKQDGDK